MANDRIDELFWIRGNYPKVFIYMLNHLSCPLVGNLSEKEGFWTDPRRSEDKSQNDIIGTTIYALLHQHFFPKLSWRNIGKP
jgi:hypothetical protein